MYTDQLQPLPYLLPTEQNKLYIFIYIYIAVFRQFNKKSTGGSCRVLGINFYPTQQTFIIKVCTYTGLKLLLHTCSGFATIICISIRNKRIDHSRKNPPLARPVHTHELTMTVLPPEYKYPFMYESKKHRY